MYLVLLISLIISIPNTLDAIRSLALMLMLLLFKNQAKWLQKSVSKTNSVRTRYNTLITRDSRRSW